MPGEELVQPGNLVIGDALGVRMTLTISDVAPGI